MLNYLLTIAGGRPFALALLSYASPPSKLLVGFTGICYHQVPGLHLSTQLAPAALCQQGPGAFKACQVLVLEAKTEAVLLSYTPCCSPGCGLWDTWRESQGSDSGRGDHTSPLCLVHKEGEIQQQVNHVQANPELFFCS